MNMKNEFVLNVSYEDFLEIEICSNVGCHLLNWIVFGRRVLLLFYGFMFFRNRCRIFHENVYS
jgi:hypothetical protein